MTLVKSPSTHGLSYSVGPIITHSEVRHIEYLPVSIVFAIVFLNVWA